MIASTTDRSTVLRDAALAYARRGWSVVPVHVRQGRICSCGKRSCPSVAKHPMIRWRSRTIDPAPEGLVRKWWRRWPDANVGIVTGAVSGIVVCDVDPRNGGDVSLAALEEEWGGLPETTTSRTGGGGRHLWFAVVDEEVSTGTIAPGLDVKGEGGMVVAPPSIHASGAPYEWMPGRDPDSMGPAPVPPALVHAAGETSDEEGTTSGESPPARTASEQAEFAALWARLGVELRSGDRHYLCPFHADHHPSLHVDAERCRWYCFGCDRGGGIGALRYQAGEHTTVRGRARLTGLAGRRRPITIFGRRRVDVVGESHHQDALHALAGGRRTYGGVELEAVAELVADEDNPFDPEAVEVRIDDRVVGHVRREDLPWVHEVVEDSVDLHGSATCRAVIRGGWDRGRGDVGLYGVTLLLDDGAVDTEPRTEQKG